jgi:catechol 2,3-dioxygenase-like lactoylglutathione lyase family enzyme
MRPTCTHVAIFARDVEKSVSFYRRYAALCEVHRRTEHGTTVVWLGEEGRERVFVIVLIGVGHEDAVEPAPLAHIGYAVGSRSEVDRIAESAGRDGCLKQAPTEAGPIVGYYCVLEDPDGNHIEFSFGQSLGPAA